MPDTPRSERDRAFLLLMSAIGVLILLAVVVLVVVVLVYRAPPGRNLPSPTATPVANVVDSPL
jgi:hypothetical protein